MISVKTESKETVTVVVPVYNRERLLIRCLDSVFAQTYRPIHLIVVDNNSTDGSWEVADKWCADHEKADFRTTLLREERPGAAAARQKGLDAAETDKIYFFDSDDEMYPGILMSAIEAFKNNPDTDLVYWRLKLNSLDGKSYLSHTSSPKNLLWNHFIHSILCTPGYLTTVDRYRKAGGWNPDARVWDDWELGIRLLLLSPKTLQLSEIGAEIYCQEQSITGTEFSSRHQLFEKILDMVQKEVESSSNPEKEQLIRLIDYRRVILAAHYRREGSKNISSSLLRKVLSSGRQNLIRRTALRIIYYYTAIGGRGASIFWKAVGG